MLTALDFPEDLLYSREAIWLRDGGAGSARIGLNAFAVFGSAADVYFVKLPKLGAKITAGKPFGHIDLGKRTVELVSPVTGTVLYPNTDLRGEPQLLVREPFGRGYLLEVEGVSEEEMDGLLDREEAAESYARFADGKIEADQKIQLGRPWPSETTMRVGGQTLVRSRIVPPLGNEEFTPDWVIGDTWRVESKAGDPKGDGPVRYFAFEVSGDSRVATEECVRLKVVEVAAPGASPVRPPFHRVLHYRLADHALLAWDEVATDDPLSVRRHYNPRGPEAWLALKEAKDGFIIDTPKFPSSVDDEARDLPEGPDKKKLPAMTHYVKFRSGLTRIESEMRTDVEREDGRGTERLLATLTFERGEPWWTEASRMLGDKELVRAKLLKA